MTGSNICDKHTLVLTTVSVSRQAKPGQKHPVREFQFLAASNLSSTLSLSRFLVDVTQPTHVGYPHYITDAKYVQGGSTYRENHVTPRPNHLPWGHALKTHSTWSNTAVEHEPDILATSRPSVQTLIHYQDKNNICYHLTQYNLP